MSKIITFCGFCFKEDEFERLDGGYIRCKYCKTIYTGLEQLDWKII